MKPIRTLVIVLVIIAALAATFFLLLKTEPKDETAATPTFAPSQTVNLYKTEKENISLIKVTTDGSSYTVSKTGDKWIVNNDASIKISQSKADTLAYECSSVVVKQLVAENVTDFAQYGLKDPASRVDITLIDGSKVSILIGSKTADGSLNYIMLEGDDKVYVKSSSGSESLALKLEKLRDATLYSLDEEKISSITIDKKDSNKIVLEKEEQPTDEGEDPIYIWKMKAPLIKDVSDYALAEDLLPNIVALSFDGVAADNPQNLSAYGLDAPYAVYTVSDAENTYTVSVGNETESGRYVKTADSAAVYVVESSKLEFLKVGYLQMVDKLIYLENIEDVSGVTISGISKSFEMQIEGSGDNAGYKINSVPVSEDDFKKAYQSVLGIMLDDFVEVGTKPSGSPACTVTYHKKDGQKSVVEYYDWDERNYLARVNGEGNLLCRKKQISSMLERLEQTISE